MFRRLEYSKLIESPIYHTVPINEGVIIERIVHGRSESRFKVEINERSRLLCNDGFSPLNAEIYDKKLRKFTNNVAF